MSNEQTAGDWIDLCSVDELPSNGGKYVNHDKRSLAIFRTKDGELRILDDICPHAGGSLSGGWISDGCVYCPWHAWPFKLDNGECPDNPSIKVRTYEARIVEDRVQAIVPPRPTPPGAAASS